MNNLSLFLLVISVWLSITGCEHSTIDKEAAKQQLLETSREWSKVAASGNIDSTLTYWADDAVMMPPGKAPIRGKDGIRKYLHSTTKIPGFEISWEPQSAHISDDGSMGYLIEKNRIAFTDSLGKQVVQHNKTVTVWRKADNGNWKNIVDMWNSAPKNW